ncbi:MAG: hypothetical protein J1D88_04165 [Treponema sp.]|nr:hypothetical protein [Treponema sp.]
MILTVFMLYLVVLGCSALLFFILMILLQSLSAQKINAEEPLFSRTEIEFVNSHPEAKPLDTGVKAVVLCSAQKQLAESVRHFSYAGERDCSLFFSMYDAEGDCTWSCIGFGDCMRKCPRDAIMIVNGTAEVTAACNGCGLCLDACPKHLISLVPKTDLECRRCAAPDGTRNGCSECGAVTKIPANTKKGFQFWQKCYKMIHRNTSEQ